MGAAVTLLVSASALGAGVLTTEQVAIGGAGAQQNPAIAIDPDAPLNAAVVAEDLSGGGLFPRTVTASSLDWSGAAWPAATLPHPGQSPSAGQPDLAWGVDGSGSGSGPGPDSEVVYLVEEASTSNSICTPGNDGVFFSSSDDGGAHWDTSLPVTTRRVEDRVDRAGDRSRPQHPRPRLHRVLEAHLRGCQLHRQPDGLRDLPDLLHERRGLVVSA